MDRLGVLALLALSVIAAPCLAAGYVKSSSGCQVLNWNEGTQNPTYIWAGDCVSGLASGRGVLISSIAGSVFSTTEGSMDRGAFNGPVKIQWADGRRYEGEVRRGALTGRGTFRSANGEVVSGVFENGSMVQDDRQATSTQSRGSSNGLSYSTSSNGLILQSGGYYEYADTSVKPIETPRISPDEGRATGREGISRPGVR